MLRITRKEDQSFMLFPSDELPNDMTVAELFSQGPIEVIIEEARTRHVKVAIDAPLELCVLRHELYNKLEDQL